MCVREGGNFEWVDVFEEGLFEREEEWYWGLELIG